MHKPKPVLENETHKILWDFKIETDHLILARRPDLVIVKKKKKRKKKENRSNSGLCRSRGPQGKTEVKQKRNKYLDLARKLKKIMDGDTNCNWSARHSHQQIGTRTGGLRNLRTSRDPPDYRIVKIGQNTKKSPGY